MSKSDLTPSSLGFRPSARLKAEQEGLARIAANPHISVVARVAAVLVAHSRRDAGSCICGWGMIGGSHPKHIAEALDEAGLLAADAVDAGRSADE